MMGIIEVFLYFAIGFAITIKAPTLLLTTFGNEALASSLSSLSLHLALLLSVVVVCLKRKSILPIIVAFGLLGLMLLVQPFDVNASLFSHKILVVGLSGFVCGYAADNSMKLIYMTGGMSAVYGLVYIAVIAQGLTPLFDSMILGYTLAPLVCWLLLLWLISKRRVFFAVEIIALSLSMFFVSSRGCVLTVVIAVLIIMYFNTYKTGEKKGFVKMAKVCIPIVVLGFVGYKYIMPHVIDSPDAALSGSLAYKMNDEMLFDDNGRDDIMKDAIALLKDNAIHGVGICKDRGILGYAFPHNIFVEVFLHYGIPLGLFLFFMYWRPIIALIKVKRHSYVYSALILIMCCYTWIRLFVSDTYIDNMYPLMFVLGVALSMLKVKPIPTISNDNSAR